MCAPSPAWALGRARLAQAEREGEIAAQDHAAFARQPVGEPRRHRADAGDRHHAEPDAGDEHIEAAQSAAQLAQGEAQREGHARGFV
jgi:hypothetical protein